MEEEKKEKAGLPIFENCPSKPYIVTGFTSQDIIWVAFTGLIGIIIGIILYINGRIMSGVFIGIMVCAFGVLFFRRDQYTENCIDKIRIIYSYYKNPKKYEYKYINVYENIED